ncbi:hypothetical protein GCM10023322_53900 [Rugosimonospora acidiphila]|uniref:Uncharacterized protein n=1 Tax=Rugosimonospora acidiphila TaxID=556531 RepID=A0ABP9SC68_9ACTN
MTNLEEELRALFAERVGSLPPAGGPAERVIGAARRLRRRRELAGLVGVFVLVLAGVSFQVVRGHGARVTTIVVPAASAYVAATQPAIKLDLRVGNQLWTSDGRRLALTGVGAVTWAYRVPAGWVYGGATGTLRLLTPDGRPVGTPLPAAAATVSPDGQEVASVSDANGSRTLIVGRLGLGGADPVAKAQLTDHAVPVAFVGASVVLGRADGTGRISAYGFWDPSGPVSLRWNTGIADVYGGSGSRLVGLVKGAPNNPDGCLSYFDLDGTVGLRPAAIGGCDLGLTVGAAQAAARSPSGKWLADQTDSGLAFIDLASGNPDRTSAYCRVRGRGAPVWEDDSEVLVPTDTGLVQCEADGVGEPVMISGLPAGDWNLVPALGR